jgi:hypothetical protein
MYWMLTSLALSAITSLVWLITIGPHVALLIPIGIAALPPLLRRGRILAAYLATLLLIAFVVIGGFSVGLYYIPAAAAMGIAAIRLSNQGPPGRLV